MSALFDEIEKAMPEADITIARSGETLKQNEWIDEMLATGIRGKGRQSIEFARIESSGGTRWVHAEAETKDGQRAVISFGPEFAPLEQRQVELAIEEAQTLVPKPKIVIFASFQFDPEAAKDIEELKWPGVNVIKVQMNTDLLKGKGTKFELYFNATRETLSECKPKTSGVIYRGDGERVLIVDDAEDQREIASAILKRLGYQVSSVSSGEEAVDYLDKHSIDLIIMDMIMDPGIDGLETYRRIISRHPGQKAIIVSGYSENVRVKEALGLGAGQYLKKPYSINKIGMAVKTEMVK